MGDSTEEITAVSILNQTYHLRSDDPDYVRDLARYVDGVMTELSSRTPTVDSLKVAVLAALHIADERMTVAREADQLKQVVTERVERFHEMLEPFRSRST